MENFKAMLKKYAHLAVKVGVNIQEGQTLILQTPTAATEFAREVTRAAYEAGAKNVHIEWNDEDCTLIRYLLAPEETLKTVPQWKINGLLEMVKEGAAYLSISATNPDLLKEVDPERVAMVNKASAVASKELRSYIQSGNTCWGVVSVPTNEWASKVFPEVNPQDRVDLLWEKIFKITRVNQEDPIKAWQDHLGLLKERLEYLNDKSFKKLYLKAPGTDLIIELPEDHIWIGGGMHSNNDIEFVPNMPTEEVFTMPLKEGVHGVVTSTKPLNYGGKLIDQFSITFEKGRIVDFTAEIGYETLKKMIETDEGSHYLGEIALVPHNSPVSNSNIIFYNTLFDENASNHLAIGMAYPLSIKDGGKLSHEELEKKGANTSLIHVDFMIGSPDMDIDGETSDGSKLPIFRRGNWAI
ncbi:aminopeptidase [Alkaliphilus serpentinus]|uniref:Aminopeptidase n=1 Tax=Alkaliphilus serpentinus TaxID=1482731 RepID=A0A833HPV8_9FIRM|nr:aminopeptidase [Alkaliphilus serpentinus]KAB3531141.1 aminopeptidase [Alkaliphilus serpentinus]